jgi:hypothetical protein
MKTLITILFLIISLTGLSQPGCGKNSFGIGHVKYAGLNKSTHAICLALQAVDKGIGVLYANKVIGDLWTYGSISHGNYWVPGTFGYIPHNKFALGIIYDAGLTDRVQMGFSLGVSYHGFHGYKDRWGGIDESAKTSYYRLNHFSGETGMRAIIKTKFWFVRGIWIGARYDPFRTESNIDIGISF